jgi:DnaA family protein
VRQLPLAVRLQDRALFDSFLAGANVQALAAARGFAAGQGATLLYLHGIEGVGKSHLLQAICAAAPGSAYVPLRQLRDVDTGALEGLAGLPLLAIDDPEAIAGRGEWERALFTLFNDCVATGARLVVAAGEPAPELPLRLPDLRSRLASMPHFALRPLDESGQREALRARAAARGIEIPDDTLQYLQRRFARDMGSLYGLLERLDAASLEAQRSLTVPFIRRVLGDLP